MLCLPFGRITNGTLKPDPNAVNYNQRTCPNRRVDYESQLPLAIDIVAVQCIYYPCLRNYVAEVDAGVLSEKLVSSVPATSKINVNDVYTKYTSIKEPCFIHNQAYDRTKFSMVPKADLKFISNNASGTPQEIPEECIIKRKTHTPWP